MSINSLACNLQLDESLRLISADESFEQTFGFLQISLIGKSLWLMLSDRYGTGTKFMERVRKSLARQGAWRGEVWLRRADGEENIMFVGIKACQSDEGKRYQALCLSFID